MTKTSSPTSWRFVADSLETCNCNHGCGCQFNGFPDRGGCEAIIGYAVTDGNFGDVDLTGTRVVVALKYPGALHEGGGKVVMFVDEGASPDQVAALGAIFSGQAGGMPWEALAPTMASVEGPVLKPIEMTVDGLNSSFRIEDALEVRMKPLKNPVTGADQHVHITYPDGGFFWNDGNICTTETMRADYGGVTLEHPGWFANFAVVDWSNQA
jgi:hypothetical protein